MSKLTIIKHQAELVANQFGASPDDLFIDYKANCGDNFHQRNIVEDAIAYAIANNVECTVDFKVQVGGDESDMHGSGLIVPYNKKYNDIDYSNVREARVRLIHESAYYDTGIGGAYIEHLNADVTEQSSYGQYNTVSNSGIFKTNNTKPLAFIDGAIIRKRYMISQSGLVTYNINIEANRRNYESDNYTATIEDEFAFVEKYQMLLGGRLFFTSCFHNDDDAISDITISGTFLGKSNVTDQIWSPYIDGDILPYVDCIEVVYDGGGPDVFALNVVSDDITMGIAIGTGPYEKGTIVEIKAYPNKGYDFVRWNDGYPYATRLVEVTESKTYIAYFAKNEEPIDDDKPVTPPQLESIKRNSFPFVSAGSAQCLLQTRPIKIVTGNKQGFRVVLRGRYEGDVNKWAVLTVLASLDAQHWQQIGIKEKSFKDGGFSNIGCTTERGTWRYLMVVFAADLAKGSHIDGLELTANIKYNNKLK